MAIKSKLKVLLAMNDMTQKQLAEITGIRPPTVSAICLGTMKQYPTAVLDKMCKALHCQPGDISEYVEDSQEGSVEHGQL